ncbi:transposase [Streptomyces virginiae]|uniref:transposase n=1 Tax=Streptomyces virginiae TaxID=1961 RepID=UPI00367A4397
MLTQAEGDLDRVVAVEPTVVRAHRHAGRGPPKGAPTGKPPDHAFGRSRGGPSARIHLVADSRCRPLAFVLTPGQAGDAPAFVQVMTRLRVPRPVGRPRITPDVVLADKACSSRAIRRHPRRRHPHLASTMIRRKRPSAVTGNVCRVARCAGRM